MAYRLRSKLLPHLFTVELYPLLFSKSSLLHLQLFGNLQQPLLDTLLAHDFVEKSQMVSEKKNRLPINHLRIRPDLFLKEN